MAQGNSVVPNNGGSSIGALVWFSQSLVSNISNGPLDHTFCLSFYKIVWLIKNKRFRSVTLTKRRH